MALFDDILDLLPEGAILSMLAIKDNGDVLVNVKTDDWQLGYTGSDPEALLERAWAEQAHYDAQQAIKQQNKTYKENLRAVSEQNAADMKRISDEHIARKDQLIKDAKAAYKTKQDAKV